MWDIHPPDEGLDASPSPSELERFNDALLTSVIVEASEAIAHAAAASWTLQRAGLWTPILKAAIRQAVEHEIADVLRRAQQFTEGWRAR